MGIFGCGIGLGYFPLLNNAWKYFPQKKGLLSGIILCCFGMGSFFWTFIADWLINPNNEFVVSNKEEKDYGYYKPNVCDKITDFWFLMAFIVLVFMVIIGFLSFDYYEDKSIQSCESIEDEEEEKKEEKKINTKLIIRVFFSWDYSRIVIMQIGCNIFLYMVSVTMRPFGESVKKLPIKPLKTLSLINSILNGLSRIVWGFIIDLLGIKLSLYINIIIFIISSGGYYFFGGNIVLYFIINIITTIANSGNSVLMPVFNKSIIGDYYLILWGYGGLYYGVSSWIGPISVKVLNINKGGEIVYLITYLICCGFCVVSLFLAFCIGDKPIDYSKYQKVSEISSSSIELNKDFMSEENSEN